MLRSRRDGRAEAVSALRDTTPAGPAHSTLSSRRPTTSSARRSATRYLAKSPYNVVHLTLPDSEEEAGRAYRQWREDGVLVLEESGFWALSQDYVGPDGVARTRTGLVGSLRVEPYEAGTVLPHERTHRGPKEGRLRLLHEVRAQLEPIFLLYEGDAPFEVPDRSSRDRGRRRASLAARRTRGSAMRSPTGRS